MSSVLIVGSVALDSVETPFGKKEDMLGGSATYFSVAASHFAPVRMVAVVGTDFPEEARELLISRKVDLTGLQVVEGETFRWSGEYRGSMNEAITHETHLNVFQGFKPVLPGDYSSSEWVFLGNIDPVLQEKVLDQVEKPKLVALDTMNFWIEGSKDALLSVLKKIDLLVINEGELKLLSGKHSLGEGVRDVIAMGPSSIIVKRGEYGSMLFHDEQWFFVPASPEVKVLDPTGAGDSFAGGFMGAMAAMGEVNPANLRKAMVYGSITAGHNITAFGPWKLATLTEGDIEEQYRNFRKLVEF